MTAKSPGPARAVSLAVSLGDPAGIGPELICEAWVRRDASSLPPFFLCGGRQLLAAAAHTRKISVPIVLIADPAEAAQAFAHGLPVLGDEDCSYRPGEPDREGAALAFSSLKHATRLALSGEASGLVTGPVSKARLGEVGFHHPGQTEFVAQACHVSAQNAVMLLAGPNLKTVPITVHCALSQVPGLLSVDLIRTRATIAAQGLQRDFGIERPRLAICALNPHASEEGRFGDEEARIIAPAVAALCEGGIDASGPFAADSLFSPHARGSYDVAICMYHDQALIPLKALDFDNGVNMTLGLPIIRTSPDHGTAFAIAGKGAGRGAADPGAMIAAIRVAGDAALHRARTG